MQITQFTTMIAPLRFSLALVLGLFVLAGCGDDEKPEKEKDADEGKPAYERVMILKQRFEQLENSLDEMERDIKFQKQRIETARETAKDIKRSLIKGNLKGYSLDTITTDPMVLRAIEDQKAKDEEEKAEEEAKEESDNLILNGLLIVLFLVFLVIIFVVALRDRDQGSPYDNNRGTGTDNDVPPSPADPSSSEDIPESAGSSFEYGRPNDLMPGGGDEPNAPGTEDKPADGEDPRP